VVLRSSSDTDTLLMVIIRGNFWYCWSCLVVMFKEA